MRIEKNKIVFGSIILTITLFILAYSMVLVERNDSEQSLKQTQLPKLEEQPHQYDSKLEALDDLSEKRERNSPSLYDEKYLDSTGVFDPNLLDKDKQRIIDSIYEHGRIEYPKKRAATTKIPVSDTTKKDGVNWHEKMLTKPVEAKELALNHQLFFASDPKSTTTLPVDYTHEVYVEVEGDQIVKSNSRIKMRLLEGFSLNGRIIGKNTFIYGTVKFQPNRTLIKVENINHIPVTFSAFDIQDGLEGIYVENSIRGEVSKEVTGELINDLRITGVPQLSGIKRIFQRNNSNIKVAISNNYKLLLKTKTSH